MKMVEKENLKKEHEQYNSYVNNLFNLAKSKIDTRNRRKFCFCIKRGKNLNQLYISSNKKYTKVVFSGIKYKDIDKWNVKQQETEQCLTTQEEECRQLDFIDYQFADQDQESNVLDEQTTRGTDLYKGNNKNLLLQGRKSFIENQEF